MFYKKILSLLLICMPMALCALTPSDPKYCDILKQLKPNMQIGDVFLLMGPPHSFGQPPDLDVSAINNSKPIMQPQNSVSPDTPATRAAILQSMQNDPILGAFLKAPPDYANVLIWNFENNSLSVSVKVKGTIVTDVKANYTCK